MLGDFYIDAITRDDVVAFRDAQMTRTVIVNRAKGTTKQVPTSPETVNGRLRLLKSLLADAVDEGLSERDPARRVPPVRSAPRARKDLDANELALFLAKARELVPHWHPFFVAAAFTGVRFGELTALRWDDIDESAGVLHVRRAQWKGHLDTTKTGVDRQVPLTPELVDAFRAQRARLLRKQHPGLAEGWVFPARASRRRAAAPAAVLMHNTAPKKAIAACLEAAGIHRPFSVHGFRHTLNNLVRKVAHGEVVRAITGHSHEEMTYHYAHVAADEKREAIANVVALVGRAVPGNLNGGNQSGNRAVQAAEAAT